MIYRSINFSIDGTHYSIDFRNAPFWRVKDIKVYSGQDGWLYAVADNVKIEPQPTALAALKDICGSTVEKAILRLQRPFRRREAE